MILVCCIGTSQAQPVFVKDCIHSLSVTFNNTGNHYANGNHRLSIHGLDYSNIGSIMNVFYTMSDNVVDEMAVNAPELFATKGFLGYALSFIIDWKSVSKALVRTLSIIHKVAKDQLTTLSYKLDDDGITMEIKLQREGEQISLFEMWLQELAWCDRYNNPWIDWNKLRQKSEYMVSCPSSDSFQILSGAAVPKQLPKAEL